MFKKQTWSALNTKICLNNTEVVTSIDKSRKFKAPPLTQCIEFCCCWQPELWQVLVFVIQVLMCARQTFLRPQGSFFFGETLVFLFFFFFNMLFESKNNDWQWRLLLPSPEWQAPRVTWSLSRGQILAVLKVRKKVYAFTDIHQPKLKVCTQ